jgi:hypothetical protein
VPQMTFTAARTILLHHLAQHGWTTKPSLKVPQAISPDGRAHLFFKTQAVYLHEHSLHVDIRTVSPEQFLHHIGRILQIRGR